MPFVVRVYASLRGGGLVRSVLLTAFANVGMVGTSAVAGVFLARSLGPSERGDYAAITAWFWATLIVAEVGQTAAVTYYVARFRNLAGDYIATSRTIMLLVGCVVVSGGMLAAPTLAQGDADVAWCYRLIFLTSLGVLAAAAYIASLQAVSIRIWNRVRLSQPLLNLIGVVALALTNDLNLRSATILLASTISVQGALAYVLARRHGLAGGRCRRELVNPMFRYGSSQLLGTTPMLVNTRFDQLVLSQTVKSAQLGEYAVAVTLSSLMAPVVVSIGNLMFPRLASTSDTPARRKALVRTSIRMSVAVATGIALGLACTAYWLVLLLFGRDYSASVALAWILIPGGACLACTHVASDLLRGAGRPLLVAGAQLSGACLTVILLFILIPPFGATGAAIASTASYLLTLVCMLVMIERSILRVQEPIE